MTDDEAHRPTFAGPDAAPADAAPPDAAQLDAAPADAAPADAAPLDAAPADAEPTPTVAPGEASWSHPPGSAATDGGAEVPLTERPEVMAGAAFAGGLVFALLLKRLGR